MSHYTIQRQNYHGTRSYTKFYSIAGLTTRKIDAGMHTGKEFTEAIPYFDTFDLETIDILLISQYVLSFPFSVDAVVGKHLEEGGLGFSYNKDLRDRHPLRESYSSCSLSIANQSDRIISRQAI